MTIAGKKIPAYLIVFILTLLVLAVFVPNLLLPYLNDKPAMDAKHLEMEAQVHEYETAILSQAQIKENIANMEQKQEEFDQIMYVDADSSINDFQNMFQKLNIYHRLTSFVRSEETKSEITTSSGTSYYTVNLTFAVVTSKENTLKLLNYLEQQSSGYYVVRSIDSTTVISDKYDGNNNLIEQKGDLNSKINVTLYYLK